ncbi:hypothetical protein D9758_008330 [Tetrapyrgos nigripes]|uniref:Uncharacterized protein n=1 Tax=Tetrapyrgos nigripes TaxID=182062 RepID=A0A8H5LN03_9AGAR|nr:hypothetical protein D9758_008330 [Tetrapyrgos nigripes]
MTCWTVLTAGAYSFLFVHPIWSKHPIASLGAQIIWIFITWLFWVIAASIINHSLPSVFERAFAVLEMLVVDFAMAGSRNHS